MITIDIYMEYSMILERTKERTRLQVARWWLVVNKYHRKPPPDLLPPFSSDIKLINGPHKS